MDMDWTEPFKGGQGHIGSWGYSLGILLIPPRQIHDIVSEFSFLDRKNCWLLQICCIGDRPFFTITLRNQRIILGQLDHQGKLDNLVKKKSKHWMEVLQGPGSPGVIFCTYQITIPLQKKIPNKKYFFIMEKIIFEIFENRKFSEFLRFFEFY